MNMEDKIEIYARQVSAYADRIRAAVVFVNHPDLRGIAGYAHLQLYSGAAPATAGGQPTGALLWEGNVNLDPRPQNRWGSAERRVAVAQRRARGLGSPDPALCRRWNVATVWGRRANDKADHAERRKATMQRRARGAGHGPIFNRNASGKGWGRRTSDKASHAERRKVKCQCWYIRFDNIREADFYRRRKGDERRSGVSFRYRSIPDPRIQNLDRRKA